MRYFKSMLLGLLLLPLAVNAADVIPDEKAVVQFQTKTGVVTFNHTLHATLRTSECESCHHTHEPGNPSNLAPTATRKRRPRSPVSPSWRPKNSKAYHLKCKGCHEYTMKELEKPAGPTKCKLCHIK